VGNVRRFGFSGRRCVHRAEEEEDESTFWATRKVSLRIPCSISRAFCKEKEKEKK